MSINTILSVKMVYPILQDVRLPCHRQQLYVEECGDGVALKAEWQDHWRETFTLHYPFLITILTFCALAYQMIIIIKIIALKSKSSEWLGTASELKNNLYSNIFVEVLKNKNNIPRNK